MLLTPAICLKIKICVLNLINCPGETIILGTLITCFHQFKKRKKRPFFIWKKINKGNIKKEEKVLYAVFHLNVF